MSRDEDASVTMLGAAAAFSSALLCYLLIPVLRPLLARYALARPNARSSHTIPTAQGGGIAVIPIALAVAFVAANFAGTPIPVSFHAAIVSATLLALVGAADDLNPLPVLPRLVLQALAAAIMIAALPEPFRIFDWLPVWVERTLLGLALIWFVNLVNFMDGLDWMTVAEIVPLSLALAVFGTFGAVPPIVAIVAFALAGAMIGFAPFNRPVAKLFLGDVGSLPIGLLSGWMLFHLADRHLAAALLLPLYYLADATLTLFRRIARGEAVWTAHRSHFYQRATDHGFSVTSVVAHVFALNIFLALLAMWTISAASNIISVAALVAGAAAVALILWRFSQPRM